MELRKPLTLLGSGLLLTFLLGTARAEIVVVVSADNPIDGLSRAELRDIYLGRAHRFPNGLPVTPLDQKETAAAHDEFYKDYLNRSPGQVKAHWSKLIFTGRGQPPRSVPNGESMVEAVAGNPRALGYVDAGRVVDGVKVLSIE